MNILEIEDVIKGLPDQALMQEAQAPSGQVPQFLVVSEIQRRADMRKRFQTQQQEVPQQTVAEQIVSQGIASMGQSPIPLTQQPPQGMPQQGMPPQGMPPQGMPQPPMSPPMSPPMPPPMMGQPPMQPQGMAAGGVVRMELGGQLPYTGGTENYQRSPETAYLERIRGQLSPMSGEISPMGTYGMTREEFDLMKGIDTSSIPERLDPDLEAFQLKGIASQAMSRLAREQNMLESPFQGTGPKNLFYKPTSEDTFNQISDAWAGLNALDNLQEIDMSSIPNRIDMGSLPQATQEDVARVDPTKIDQTTIDAGLSGTTAEEKGQKDLIKELSLVAPDSKYDFSSALDILNQISPDYASLKPDYTAIITEQERRARKIQEDANKEASAQALIQLGAGLAAGDIASGISKAGQAVSDIRGRGRAEAREEEALARKMQLASDEAGMRLGLAEMEANRAIQLERAGLSAEQAKLQAKAERGAYEFEKTFGISLREIESKLQISQNANYREALSGLIELRNSVDPYSEEGAKEIAKYDSQIRSIIKRIAPELASTLTDGSGGSPAQVNGGEFKLVGTRSSE